MSLSGLRLASSKNSQESLLNTRKSGTRAVRVFFVFSGFVVGLSLFLYRQSSASRFEPTVRDFDLHGQAVDPAIMVGVALPGRPGNLTPDQEVKLRELWKVTLKVFGMPFEGDSGANSIVIQNGNSETASQEDQSPQDKKKKRRSMFSRKHHDGNKEDELDGGGHTDASIDSEDKYGQRKEFNRAIASQSPEDLRKAFWGMVKNDHPDGLLLRFLRARKWDVERALIMLISTMQWRMHEMHVDEDVIKKGEGGAAAESQSSNAATKKEGEDFMAQLRLGKSFLHGTDREGRPLCFVRARLHKQGEQSEASLERYTVYVIETARLLLSPPVDTAVSMVSKTLWVYRSVQI